MRRTFGPRGAWAELRAHPTRLVAVGLAVTISVAFLVACGVFVATETQAASRRLTAESSTSDVLVNLPGGRDRSAAVAAVPGVAAVATTSHGYVDFTSEEGPGLIRLQSLPDRPEFRWSRLTTGGWPVGADQVAVSTVTADNYGLHVGSTLTVQAGRGAVRLLQVSGIVDEGHLLLADPGDSGTVDAAFFRAQRDLGGDPTLLVRTDPGTDPDVVAERLQTLLGPQTTVQTAAEARADALTQATGVRDLFGYLVTIFGAIALLVGSIIIVNTYGIILGARRQEIGLLRAVGASTAQVRRRLLTEALLIGLLGSVAGVVVGVAVAALGSTVSGAISSGLVLPYGRLLVVGVGGTAVTALAALVPVLRATRVAPLAALRPVAEPDTVRRTGRLRLVAGGLLVGLGAALAGWALQQTSHIVLLTAAGAFLAATGVLALTGSFVPPLLRIAGRLTHPLSPVARLGAVNLTRNPGRAAATATALMLAVGLIVTLQVGAASLRSTSDAALDTQFPVDLTVTNPSGPLSPTVQAAVAATPGIVATSPVRIVTAGVGDAGSTGERQQLQVVAPGDGADRVVAAGLAQLTDRTALAHHTTIEGLGLRPGDPLALRYGGHRMSVVLVASDVADAGQVVVSDATMTALAPTAPTAGLWAAAADRRQAAQISAGVRKALVTQPGLVVAGSLPQAAEVGGVLDTVLDVATALLAVAALIALVGVGNTLGLSVLERTRESALLRALGLQRRQLRGMLAVEAVLLALVGAVIGVAAGVVFGSLGAAAVTRQTEMGDLHLAVPVTSTLVVLALSVLAGAAASVLPARRAATASPTAALAAG
ncbi:FtsX-like permease family protein [uncultured Friedmanniella sp.]|uniref:FtsX-like permease family protein n=1 Tax=uncultured Friedmanniella sp. TaxID=335381 RepID=UPI0035C99B12